MKKLLLILSLAVSTLSSCQMANTPTAVVKDTVFINTKLQAFIDKHPDWEQNEIKQEAVESQLADSLIVWRKDAGFLKNMPFELESIDKINENGKILYAASFRAGSLHNPDSYTGLPVTISVLGIVNKDDVEKLTNGKHYFLQGKYFRNIKGGLVGKVSTDYYLGNHTFEITGFKEFVNYPDI